MTNPRTTTATESGEGYNFPCICGGPTTVLDSRPSSSGIRRRRRCKRCDSRWTTYERKEEAVIPTLGVLGRLQTQVRQMREHLDKLEVAILEAGDQQGVGQ